jgi:hypothetical protein
MFHITQQETTAAVAIIATLGVWFVAARVLDYLKVIAYNTGRTSENVAEVLHLLRNSPKI